jgi:hypothetical protein
MYIANIEANMPDDDIAEYLSTDTGWLEAQWPECVRQAQAAGKTVNGNPAYDSFTKTGTTQDGNLYNFKFNVPTSN